MTRTQDQLFDTFLDDACANLTSAGILAPPHTCDSVAEPASLAGEFHRFISGIGSPFSDRAEAAEVALDAVASVIAGLPWPQWLHEPADTIGKQGYRAEALLLICALAEDAEPVQVRDWYNSRSGLWDDPGYDRSSDAAAALRRIGELAGEAAGRADGYLACITEA
ncbi:MULTISPECIES: hypothetical protein [Mycobacteriaceae]|uniref:DUF1877 family protein n=1 Tax=Mycolicibacterium senegalense TaxID=1796 RepID=A0ABR5FMM6_9MYCO|nr:MULTISPECIES: hypothetical protein [Mycolicibacterium]KLI09303.1 hypothetical protein AA982_04420 [Mycolicibacterium senegalense]KLO47695.1 hypothetical protein ABW05_31440 [Mycolicibacterium senegalense]OMB84065.1 hypothetical protein A5741_20795 [Mycolicibacterium conceptionense]